MDSFSDFSRRAVVPEQIGHYVRPLSPCSPLRVGDCLGWRDGGSLVLAAFPLDMRPGDPPDQDFVDRAAARALALPWLERLTVLAPCRPAQAPPDALCTEDECWGLDLPPDPPRGKLASLLRRADALTRVTVRDAWSPAHEALAAEASRIMARRREGALSPGSALLFSRVGRLVREGRVSCCSARRRDTGDLCGLAVADHTTYSTAFYLFAFRAPDAPPGTADALLAAILREGTELGQIRCSLGLGIHPGIRFFKRKWGAKPWFPVIECSWQRKKPGFLARLFGR